MTSSTSAAPAAQDEGRSGRRLATLLGAAALVMILVILALVIGVGRRGDNPPAAAPAPAPPAANPVDGAPGPATLTAAPVARWELYQGIAVPYSPEYGPRTVQGLGPATGYSHNAAGALFAAAQLSVRAALAPDDSWRSVVDTQVLDSPGKTAFIKAREATSIAPYTVPSSSLTQYAAFRVVNYTDSMATLGMALRTKTGSLQEGQVTVVWSGLDWRLSMQPDGSVSSAATVIPSLVGYIPWSGV